MPKIVPTQDMYAFSYFFDKFAAPFGHKLDFEVGHIKNAAHLICSSTPPTLNVEGMKELEKNGEWCTDLGYMYSLLSIGYELEDTRKISSLKKVDGIEIGWSLGCAIKMLEESRLCSQF